MAEFHQPIQSPCIFLKFRMSVSTIITRLDKNENDIRYYHLINYFCATFQVEISRAGWKSSLVRALGLNRKPSQEGAKKLSEQSREKGELKPAAIAMSPQNVDLKNNIR